jgi:glycosyltransferase involved in cell wall biosynthesis
MQTSADLSSDSPLADLVICIPTYNRVKELKFLLETYICPLLDEYDSRIHVVIADNSDEPLQRDNQMSIGNSSKVTYHANRTNLGYGGNILRLLELACRVGKYLWFCSDDDALDIDAFHCFMNVLHTDSACNAALYTFTHSRGASSVKSPKPSSISRSDGIYTFEELIKTSGKVVPFLHLSSYAISSRYLTADALLKMKDHRNDFAHISLLGVSIPSYATIRITSLPLIVYNSDGSPGIDIASVFRGYTEALDSFGFLTSSDKAEMNKCFLRGMLYLVLTFKGNPRPDVQRVYSPLTSSYRRLVSYLLKYPTFRGGALVLIAYLPSKLVRHLLFINGLRSKSSISAASYVLS